MTYRVRTERDRDSTNNTSWIMPEASHSMYLSYWEKLQRLN
eukprot:CAMPEP_0202887060 /NCGR_PEP_ID=MMETSP1391-20130828/42489_1 /ASSEMBLY_ACC=CAM_ASM_000867 /TAXON_ID=1034604 /ORGANISM="Chlamydomonas leiostraca, Strain SAG 11-49" /LENGTH=40 /DNA_ID= /DNA_START= /DNA_END= /DNA_ORIENTATION=